MGFETPGFNSDNKKAINRRGFLKKAVLAGGALIAGATGIKLATEAGLIGERKEKIEKVSEGVILEKKYVPGLTYPLLVGKIVIANKLPDQRIFNVRMDNNKIIDINVSQKQFDQYNVKDDVSVKYEFSSDGEIESPELLDAKNQK